MAMVLGSVVALQSPAAAATPGNLKDVDVAHLRDSLYVVAALTKGGTLQVQPMTCSYASPSNCGRHGWTTVGKNVAYAEIHQLTSERLLLVARLTNGQTWYKRGSCQGVRCTWYSWHSLGGKVVSVRAAQDHSGHCVTIAGLSPKKRVYEARVCDDAIDYGWKSLRGTLHQIGVDGEGNVFGTTSKNTLWWHDSATDYRGSWNAGGGRITQPVRDKWQHDYCGLSATRQMWCFDKSDLVWVNAGGYWRKLDNNQTIGIGRNWSMWRKDGWGDLKGYGGSLNQAAWDEDLQVGVSGSLKPWYRFDYEDANTWHPA